tara:strand:- start:1129 stop:1590 length:462 start_codon:yes stop_codon:yes gene_type:complete
MSYLALSRATFRCDILKVNIKTSLSAGDEWTIADSPIHTRATLNSGKITIYTGSHWLIESKVGAQLPNLSLSSEYITQLHDGSNYVGFPAIMSNINALNCSTNFTRALILSSDISTSMTLSIKCKSVTGTIGNNSTGATYEPVETIKIMELPA